MSAMRFIVFAFAVLGSPSSGEKNNQQVKNCYFCQFHTLVFRAIIIRAHQGEAEKQKEGKSKPRHDGDLYKTDCLKIILLKARLWHQMSR